MKRPIIFLNILIYHLSFNAARQTLMASEIGKQSMRPPIINKIENSYIDQRVRSVLNEPQDKRAVFTFAYISRGKSPRINFKWCLHQDGKLFFIRHSGKRGDWRIPFDLPFPQKETLILSAKKMKEIRATLLQNDFFSQTGYHLIAAKDGAFVILRGRNNSGEWHTVVYENFFNSLTDYFFSLTERLR